MPRKIKFTKAQAGSMGGKKARGKKKVRGDAAYYRSLRARPVKAVAPRPSIPSEEVPPDDPPQTVAAAPDPMAALPGETETARRLRLDLPILEPVLHPPEPKGFTWRPDHQS